MVRQHHRLNGHESEETLGDSERQGSLAMLQSMDSLGVENNLEVNLNNSLRQNHLGFRMGLGVLDGHVHTAIFKMDNQ